jgi:MFS family permease
MTPETRPFFRNGALILIAGVFLFVNFQVLLSTAPVLMERAAHRGGAGLANTVLLGFTTAAQLVCPMLLLRFRHRTLLVAGLLLQGLPSMLYLLDGSIVAQLSASALRGMGFGLTTVAVSVILIELAPVAMRGTFLGYFGLASAVPNIFMQAVGLQLLQSGLLWVDVVIAAGTGIAGALAAAAIRPPERELAPAQIQRGYGLGDRGLAALVVAFVLISVTWGGTVTFLPVALPPAGVESAAAFLLVSGVTRAVGRYVAGPFSDSMPSRRLLVASGVILTVGLGLTASRGGAAAAIAGAAAYGLGSGAFQTVVYVAMLARAKEAHFGTVSALWNISIDLGGVIGTSTLGLMAAIYGYAPVLWAMPLLGLLAIPVVIAAFTPRLVPQPQVSRP